MSASPFSWATKLLGTGALVLTLLLVVGWLLPTDWEVEASTVIAAPAEAVFRYLDSPEGWRDWTTWPQSGLERTGPARGEGARIAWNDLDLGSGSFTLTSVLAPERVEYVVEVSGGAMRTVGVITLVAEAGGVRVRWRESGDLGDNPLMGFWGLRMERAQSQELVKSLDRLAGVASAAPPPAADIVDGH